MHDWTVHGKVDFPKCPPCQLGGITPKIDSSAHSSKLKTEMTCHNSHTQNALQCNTRCYFGGRVLSTIKILPIWGVHSTTFPLELRNERFTLVSFVGFIKMHKYKLFLLVLLPRIPACINIKLFLHVLLPRNILNYSQN